MSDSSQGNNWITRGQDWIQKQRDRISLLYYINTLMILMLLTLIIFFFVPLAERNFLPQTSVSDLITMIGFSILILPFLAGFLPSLLKSIEERKLKLEKYIKDLESIEVDAIVDVLEKEKSKAIHQDIFDPRLSQLTGAQQFGAYFNELKKRARMDRITYAPWIIYTPLLVSIYLAMSSMFLTLISNMNLVFPGPICFFLKSMAFFAFSASLIWILVFVRGIWKALKYHIYTNEEIIDLKSIVEQIRDKGKS